MRIIILLVLNLVSLTSLSQSELGIGIVSINFNNNNNTLIDFYEGSDLNKKVKTIEFFKDESINSWNIKDLENQQQWLQPESLWLDYHQFSFRTKTNETDCFEIYVSDTKTMWIKNTDYIEFHTWEEYLQNMFSIERVDKNTQNIYSKPFTNSEIVKLGSKEDCFTVIRMQNDWIEVETGEHCENGRKIKGWLEWRNDDKLLINYYTTS
ncbi:hypothetical protein [Nonlabens ponticola]|uniref:SH3 domain-containing protein n=1 Tax=Nonlabens ponticola TaxID=2496866 RepID=A0A3S9MYF7_9FLAO|nr:hypothetical protein [Nonlabens ponticola]AZQ44182.1 hypothetical protein EJ995_08030 [Nonlabens ponticola]